MVKEYRGYRLEGASKTVVTVDGKALVHVVHHSPTGLEWGYGGSGPSDLALSILADFFGEGEQYKELKQLPNSKSLKLYQAFKRDFVARFPRKSWMIDSATIARWVAKETGEGNGSKPPPDEHNR
jgi:hypothetical protein